MRGAAGRRAPLLTRNIRIDIEGMQLGGWKRVTIPGSTTEKVKYREGQDAGRHGKVWGQNKYGKLVIERNLLRNQPSLWEWRKYVIDGKIDSARRKVTVTVVDEHKNPQVRWKFSNAWPSKYSAIELGSAADQKVVTETLYLEFEDMARKTP